MTPDERAATEKDVMDKAVQKAIDSCGVLYSSLPPEGQAKLRGYFETVFRQSMIEMEAVGKHAHETAVDGVLKILQIGRVQLPPFIANAIREFKEIG